MNEEGTPQSIDVIRDEPAFPISKESEVNKLQEILVGKDATLIQFGEDYIVHFNNEQMDAEGPLISFDLDDVCVQTSVGKAECWDTLAGMGLPDEIVAYADKISRLPGAGGDIYEPQLEMRIVSQLLKAVGNGSTTDIEKLKEIANDTKERILAEGLESSDVNEQVSELFDKTRYNPELYPDTLETLAYLRNLYPYADASCNVVILTFGDPQFQLQKALSVVEEGLVNEIWLTGKTKGDFLKNLYEQTPHVGKVELNYTEPDSTMTDGGIHFAEWQKVFVHVDDEPTHVDSINNLRDNNGNEFASAVRVRRPQTSRYGKALSRPGMEVDLSNTLIDKEAIVGAIANQRAILYENYLANIVRNNPSFDFTDPSEYEKVEQISAIRQINPLVVIRQIQELARQTMK